ncbi:MAG TPA: CdaR family protein [Anaerolineae bacterium]
MLHWLVRNIGNILLSIILAAVVWVIAVNETNPNRQDIFRNIPIAFINSPEGTVVYSVSASSVEVTLSAPELTWASLSASVLSATVDLSQAAPGEGSYRVNVSVVPESIGRLARVLRVDPASIDVTVESLLMQEVPVQLNLVGEPPVGYKVSRTVVRPVVATVTGPASWVSRVTSATGEFSVQGVSQSLSQTLTLKPVDADGRTVSNVTVNPERASLSVDIEQLAGFRDVAVKVVLTGTQASGYRLAEVNVVPPSVTVIGSPAALSAMPGFVETESIDITAARADIERDVNLNLPPDVALYDPQPVRVMVKIEPVVSSLTISSALTFTGLPPTLSARASPESVEVILAGALPVLEQIDPARDVRVILDLTDLGIGTHQVEPRVETLEGITAQSILPSTIQVTIERAPPGTPTPSPTPRPTPTERP